MTNGKPTSYAQAMVLAMIKKALDVLDQKLEKGVITDERYKERAAIHSETLARTS